MEICLVGLGELFPVEDGVVAHPGDSVVLSPGIGDCMVTRHDVSVEHLRHQKASSIVKRLK